MAVVGKPSQYYSGFSPTSIPGCALWLDAADSNSLTLSGSNVTSWRDKSGNGRDATVTGGAPTRSTAGFGGRQSVLFNGTADNMGGTMSITSNVLTAFALFQPTALRDTVADQRVLTFASGTNPDWNSIERTTGINIQAGIYNNQITTYRNSTFIARSGTAVTVGGQFIGVAQYNGVNGLVFMNGTAGVTIAASSGVFNILKYGVANQPTPTGERLYGYIAEMIVFEASLTTVERQQVEGYLAGKWGLRANIPATHPFKTRSPFTRAFIPVDISGCSLWLDAADNTSLTLSGSNVTTWFDKSGNGRNAVVSSNAFATLSGTPQGLLFNNSFYTTTLSADPAIETGFVVYNVSSAGVLVGAYNAGREIAFQSLTLVGPLKAQIAWGAVATTAGNVRQLVTTFVSSTATTSAVNGETAVSAAGLTFTSGNVTTLGREVGTNFPYGGFIHEIVLFNVNLSRPERQEVETYLANKWGLRGLTPAGHYARLAPALTTSFLPTQIGTCSVWLDAGDLTTMTLSGSNVTAWRDKSGTGANATFVGTSVYSSANRYVQTPGGSGYFTVPCDLRKSTTPQCSLFTVHRWITNNGGNQSVWGTDVGGGWNRIQLLHFPAATQYAYGLTLGGASPNTYPVNGLNTLNTVIYSAIYDLNVTNGTTAHVDGSQNAIFTEGAPATQTSTQLTFFGEGGGGAFNTKIGFNEIIIFRFKLTPRERQQVEGYLANKWGLTSKLPAGHPFKVVRP